MIEEQQMITIEKGQLLERVAELRSSGYRLVQICPTTLADRYEMNYSFALELQFINLRFAVFADESIPSIGLIYWNAFLYENEIHDLFGIAVAHMTVDYGGKLYRTAIPTPFSLEQVRRPAAKVEKTVSDGDTEKTGGKRTTPGGSDGH